MIDLFVSKWRTMRFISFLSGAVGFLVGWLSVSGLQARLNWFDVGFYTGDLSRGKLASYIVVISITGLLLFFALLVRGYVCEKYCNNVKIKYIFIVCVFLVIGILLSLISKSILDLWVSYFIIRPASF